MIFKINQCLKFYGLLTKLIAGVFLTDYPV
jgi:hypothetical protein